MSDLLDSLNDRKNKLEESNRRYEQAAEKAKEIADLQKKQDSLQNQIGSYLSEAKPQAGTIKRLTAGLGALSPVDAIYKANEAASKQSDAFSYNATLAKTLATSYAKSIRDNVMTAATNKDYTVNQKTYKDILTNQMGMKDGTMATVAGVAGDIGTDPINFLGGTAFKGVSKLGGMIGKEMEAIASKSSLIEKGIKAVKAKFNLFAEVEKFNDPKTLAQFKEAFSEAAESKDFNMLRRMGFDVTDFKGTGTKAVGNTPTNYSFRNSQGQFVKKQDYQKFQGILEEAFGAQEASGMFGKALDATSGVFKRLMSWSPKFQTRNMMGAVTQGLMEGAGPKDYYKATKMVLNQGKDNPAEWAELVKQGLTKSTGMFEQEMSRIPAKVANFGESVNRIALYLSEKSSGKSLIDAVEKTRDVFYKYPKEYMSKFEKKYLSRIDPFYAFDKGQMQYWPGGLGRNAAKYNALGDIKNDTAPEDTKKYPFLTPDYWKDMFSVGTIGNIGFQLEDFLKNVTIDTKNWWGRLQPLLKGTVELVTDWKVFQGKSLSGDKAAGQYANLPEPARKIFGFDAISNTVNPYMKWATELMAGPIMDPIKNLFDPKKGILSVFTSIRDYTLTKENMYAQSEMQTRQDKSGGFWGNLQNRFSFGPKSASAETSASGAGSPVLTNSYLKFIADWAKKNSTTPDKFAKEYQFHGGGEQTQFFNAQQKWGKERADLSIYYGDIAEGDEKAHLQRLGNLAAENKFYGRSRADADKALADENIKYDKTRVRKIGEAQAFSEKEITTYSTLGLNPRQIAFNKAQEKYTQGQSKLAETWRAAGDKSPQSINKAAEAEVMSARAQSTTSGLGTEWLNKMVAAITAKRDNALEDLAARNRIAVADIIDNWAKAEVNGIRKIELERRAAQERYSGSGAYKDAKARKDTEQIRAAQDAIDQVYDRKKQDQLAKMAKENLERIKTLSKNEAENLILALDGIYQRGGRSIDKYYGEKLKIIQQQYATTQDAILQTINVPVQAAVEKRAEKKFDVKYDVKAAPGANPSEAVIEQYKQKIEEIIATTTDINEFENKIKASQAGAIGKGVQFNVDIKKLPDITPKLKEFDDLVKIIGDPKTDPAVMMETIEKALTVVSGSIQGIDMEALATSLNNLANNSMELAGKTDGIVNDIEKDKRTFDKAVTELEVQSANLRNSIYAKNTVRTLGVTSLSKDKGMKWGMSTSPIAPKGFDADKLELESQQNKDAAQGYQSLMKTDETYKSDEINLPLKNEEESNKEYMTRIEADLQMFEENKEALSKAGQAKLIALKKSYVDYMIMAEDTVYTASMKRQKQAMDVASGMAGMISQTASMLYEESGKQSKAAFYVMKAASMAEAIIKGAEAVMNAYTAGSKISPAIGTAYASVAAAFAATQVSIIANSMINGKALGGKIEGGSGTKDDVPIMAMKDEYVIKQSSARKYGYNFLNALNEGLIPISNLQFNVPAVPAPNYAQTSFAEGGQVSMMKGQSAINVGGISVSMDNKLKGAVMRDELEVAVSNVVRRFM